VPSSGFFRFCLPGDKFRSRKRANGASGARLAAQLITSFETESEGPTRRSSRHSRLIDAERQLQGFPEAMVGQFEDGYAAFEGMQDQDVLGDQCGLTLRLSMSQARTSATDERNLKKWGFRFFRISQPPLGRRAPGHGPGAHGRPESTSLRREDARACSPFRSPSPARGCADSG